MDEAAARTRAPGRRMASAKTTTSPGRSRPAKGTSKSGTEPEVSTARWAGVAFVIVAIVAATVLAVVSPSESAAPVVPGQVAEASPSPAPTTLGGAVPEATPQITSPIEGTTREIDIEVEVAVPKVELPKRDLVLHIMRGEEELKTLARPKPGSTVTVPGVRIDQGPNELTAVLSGPGGPGPASDPVLVTVDRSLADLVITAPEDKYSTYEESVLIEGTAAIGSNVSVENKSNGATKEMTVGPSGRFDARIPLKLDATNKIAVTSDDEAKIPDTETVRVRRLDGKPKVNVKTKDSLKRSELPTDLVVIVTVTDAAGEPLEGASVDYSLGAQDRLTETDSDVTNGKGRSRWKETVKPGSVSTDALELSVTVTNPLSGETSTVPRTIDFR